MLFVHIQFYSVVQNILLKALCLTKGSMPLTMNPITHAYWGGAYLTAEAALLAGLVVVCCEAADGPGWSHLHAAERPDPCD